MPNKGSSSGVARNGVHSRFVDTCDVLDVCVCVQPDSLTCARNVDLGGFQMRHHFALIRAFPSGVQVQRVVVVDEVHVVDGGW